MDTSHKKKVQSVKLNLQNGQVEIILRALELYKFNLNYMLDTTKAMPENNLLEDIIPIDKKLKIC